MQYVFVYVPNFHPHFCFIPAATRLVVIVHTNVDLASWGACPPPWPPKSDLGPQTTFYWSAIVNIALSCTVFELFDVE